MLNFPSLIELSNGMTLGAAQLNNYKMALEYLLGESHATTPLTHSPTAAATLSTSYETLWRGYLYHTDDTVAWCIRAQTDQGGAQSWYCQLVCVDGGGSEHVVASSNGTHSSPAWGVWTGTANIASLGLTKGKVYEWRVKAQVSASTYHTYVEVWRVAERGVVTGWVAPHNFADGTTSDAAHFNTWKSALEALYNGVVSPVVPTTMTEPHILINNPNYATYTRGVWRYRPNGLSIALHGHQEHAFSGRRMQWRAVLRDTADHQAVVWESAVITPTGLPDWWWSPNIDLTSGAAASALAAAGITLSFGSYYRLDLEVKTIQDPGDTDPLVLDRACLARISSGAPAGGWVTPHAWKHGDTDVRESWLDPYSNDLTMLYSGGEILWGETPAVTIYPGPSTDMWAFSGRHCRRWLAYRYADGQSPTIWYGNGFTHSYALPSAGPNTWISFDTEAVRLPVGGAFCVTGVVSAFECDAVVS